MTTKNTGMKLTMNNAKKRKTARTPYSPSGSKRKLLDRRVLLYPELPRIILIHHITRASGLKIINPQLGQIKSFHGRTHKLPASKPLLKRSSRRRRTTETMLLKERVIPLIIGRSNTSHPNSRRNGERAADSYASKPHKITLQKAKK
ncbi:hypothetical protein ACUY2L_07600 [Corynebacterium mastitidis]